MTRYFCCDKRRRTAVSEHATLMGIDFIEVTPDQQRLEIHFVLPDESLSGTKPKRPPDLTPGNIQISGGERITAISVLPVDYPESPDNVIVVTVKDDENPLNGTGDFTSYTLRLVSGPHSEIPPANLDPRLSAVEFSFKVGCPSEFDCREEISCPSSPRAEPDIDYLAKDYASFRRLLLDRMSVVLPGWQERIPADIGVALVDMLAYVGDQLSYRQDAVATEAYLGTARLRTSVRRHARLVDYSMHDGCNARVWVQVTVSANLTLPAMTRLLTRTPGLPEGRIAPNSQEEDTALAAGSVVFETMHEVRLDPAHNELHFHTWGDSRCCLPTGATRATLAGRYENLRPNDVLIFEERMDPKTGLVPDANPSHRYAVRLIAVSLSTDPLGGRFHETPSDDPVDITEIEWHSGDALPFPLCISANTGQGFRDNISVAFGNIVLADHGLTIASERLAEIRPSSPWFVYATAPRGGLCEEAVTKRIPVRYRPQLAKGPITQAVKESRDLFDALVSADDIEQLNRGVLPGFLYGSLADRSDVLPALTIAVNVMQSGQVWVMRAGGRLYILRFVDGKIVVSESPSASGAVVQQPGEATPQIKLDTNRAGEIPWKPKRDLLNSGLTDQDFVVEVENDGRTRLRFGDDVHGKRPAAETEFTAAYRIGNGARGNVGASSLASIATADAGVTHIRNPLPAIGGVDPEALESVRQAAPFAFRTQERAVTPADYAEVAERHPGVQRAAATFRWTGSWRTVFVTVDRVGGLRVDAEFETEMRRHMERYRMAGYDLEIDGPRFVSLEIAMHVCVEPGYLRSEVKRALLNVFSHETLADGRRGVFHPDNFSFGQAVYLSPLYAAAQAVSGVSSVEIIVFQRQGQTSTSALDSGRLTIGRLEIARLDNDPNYPEHGIFRLELGGGL